MYAGFDVFDTLLGRKISPPTAVFDLLGRQLKAAGVIDLAPGVFGAERAAAERRCYRNIGNRTTIHDIHRELQVALSIADSAVGDMVQAELALERKLIYPVSRHAELVQKCRKEGRRIVYVSDMYLPSDFIESLLRDNGIFRPGDRLFVSCEWGETKSTSGLFRHVLNELNIGPAAMKFYGNHIRADVRGAEKAGISSKFLPLCNSNRFEAILERDATPTEGYTAALAGASKSARLKAPSLGPDGTAIQEIAAGVAAPMLVSYVLWLLRTSKALGIRRLYFLSRDGQILLHIAHKLVARLGLEIECSYLFASRPALARAFGSSGTGEWYLGDITKETSAFDILSRLQATDDRFLNALRESGFPAREVVQPMSETNLKVLSAFLRSDRFQDLHAEVREREKCLILSYLSGEGVFEDRGTGIVDIGWSGTLHDAICKAAVENGTPPPFGFLFGSKKTDGDFTNLVRSYYFDLNRRMGHPNPLEGKDLFFLAEMFCCADHGTVTGFQSVNGKVIPQLEKTWPDKIGGWSFHEYRETVRLFVDALDVLPHHNPLTARDAIGQTIVSFWKAPTRLEAEVWSRFPWDSGMGNEPGSVRMAEALSLRVLLRRIFRRRHVGRDIIWPAASVVLAPRWITAPYGWLKSLRRRLRGVPLPRRWKEALRNKLVTTAPRPRSPSKLG